MNRPPEVDAWIDALDIADRELYTIIETAILGTGLVDEITYSYKLPTFKHGKLPITVSKWKGGISLSTQSAAPIETFKAKHPKIRGGKVSVQFPRGTDVPLDDLTELITAALTPSS